MNRTSTLFAVALTALGGLAATAAATAGNPLVGRWHNGHMTIQIAPCGGTLCGTVVKASAKQQAKAALGSGTDLIGATLIRDIQPTGPSSYKARVFLADRNIMASGTIRMLDPDRLGVKGCVWMVLCKTATWQRVR